MVYTSRCKPYCTMLIFQKLLFEPVTEVMSILGFVNYVRCFITNMAESTAPLTDFLHKGFFYEWGERQQAAFDQLKTFLVAPPVLHIADPDRPYELVRDASDIAIGVVKYRTLAKAYNQPPTSRGNSKALNGMTRFMTRRCLRSSMLLRLGAATYPVPTLLSEQATSPYNSSEPNRPSIRDRFVGSNISSPISTTASPTRRGQIMLPMPFPALLPIHSPY
ncbi:hypothetical protein CLOP_g21092 [Closterium sp. NIES-67]|nr:hypothetical protein CLOP_g21092 [Closterium sp. NIES-67]